MTAKARDDRTSPPGSEFEPANREGSFSPPRLAVTCLAEAIGTFMLVLFGLGSVHAAVLTGAQSGLWQVAVVWGASIVLAIYTIGGISGAHINPAITVALALWGRFSWGRVLPYVIAQLCGAAAAAALLFGLYGSFLEVKERQKGVTRGQPGSEITAMCYCEYFPNPGPLADGDAPYSRVAHQQFNQRVQWPTAFAAEMLGTLILALVVFAVTDDRNPAAPQARLAPVFIGLTVAALISIIAPLTQACFNPARDFGPRIFAYFAGWGEIALPGQAGASVFAVYLAAPLLGAILGAGLYERVLRRCMPRV